MKIKFEIIFKERVKIMLYKLHSKYKKLKFNIQITIKVNLKIFFNIHF